MYLGKKISSHICALDTTEPALHLGEGATAQAIQEVTGQLGLVSCRFTHVYPDGPAAYFTFQALSKKAAVLEHFWTIKRAASAAIMQAGGTITHQHDVERDHRQ